MLVLRQGRRYENSFCKVVWLKNNLPVSRFAFVVSKKTSKKASVRNVLKRRLREVVRGNMLRIKTEHDIVITIYLPAKDLSFKELSDTFLDLLSKQHLLNS